MRLFVAIPLCERAKAAVEAVQARLDQGRLVPEENWHITLAFLDDQPRDVLEELDQTLRDIRACAFEINFCDAEVKGGRKAELAWLNVADAPELTNLQRAVRGAVHLCGVTIPRARFRPHVTLSRFGRASSPPHTRLAAWLSGVNPHRAGPFPVDVFSLYQSTLTPEGPIYEELARYPLASVPSAA